MSTKLRGEIFNTMIIVGDLLRPTLFSVEHRLSRQKIRKDTVELMSTLEQVNLTPNSNRIHIPLKHT